MLNPILPQDLEHRLWELAIAEAEKCTPEDERTHPKVGAIIARPDGTILSTGFRGEEGLGTHAEYCALKKAQEAGHDLHGAIIFATLEPCTVRGPDKIPCADRIHDAGIQHVYVGMFDPNPRIVEKGWLRLQFFGIDLYALSGPLAKKLMQMNSAFIEKYRNVYLPPNSVYTTTRITDLVVQKLRAKGIDISEIPGDGTLTLEDLIVYCQHSCNPLLIPNIPDLVMQARAEAFDDKYAEYTYSEDVRGHLDSWQNDIRLIFRTLGVMNLSRSRILNVGIGNGLEGRGLFDEFPLLTMVDVGRRSLDMARIHLPNATPVVAEAENLQSVDSAAYDVYVSLRTYQSQFFDIHRSVREAYRVLRPGGIAVISISNGFLGAGGSIVQGLLIPKTTVVDPHGSFNMANIVRLSLFRFGFETIGITVGLTEIYIHGRRGR